MTAAMRYIFLGLVQGLTEFLPVSSSAHLVIFQDLLGISENQIILDIVLHLGSLAAIVLFLFKDIKQLFRTRLLFYIFLATAVTAIIAAFGQGFFERSFTCAKGLVLPLLITGIALICTNHFRQGSRRLANLRIADGFWLGLVQGVAIIPGLSRSGLTISTLLFRNVEKETAFKFSFLASIFAILGALFFKLDDFGGLSLDQGNYMLLGFVASFLSGLLALNILLAVIRKARLYLFGYYCLALALLVWRLL